MFPTLDKSNFDAPTQPISWNGSRRGASLDFRFQIFWMERIQCTRSDYSPLCNTLLHPGRL
jgi:hypothetical protein